MRILRSIGAVIAGYAVFVIATLAFFRVTGRAPHAAQPTWFIVTAIACGVVFAGLGGFLASRIAPSRPRLHACITAIILAAGAAASLASSPATDATWSMWGALLLMAPACCLGGMPAEVT